VWFVHFTALYGIASFGEAVGLNLARFDIIAWVATALACLAVAMVWHRSRHMTTRRGAPPREAHAVVRLLAVLSLAGILLQGLVVAIVAP